MKYEFELQLLQCDTYIIVITVIQCSKNQFPESKPESLLATTPNPNTVDNNVSSGTICPE